MLPAGYTITPLTGKKGDYGTAAKFVEIESPDGLVFKNGSPNTITLNALAVGFQPSANSYVWKKNGTTISGQTTSSLTINKSDVSNSATYSVEVGGCKDYATVIAVSDGTDGTSPYACSVSNQNFTIATDTSLKPISVPSGGYQVVFTAYKGSSQLSPVAPSASVTSGKFKISTPSNAGNITVAQSTNGTLSFTPSTGSAIDSTRTFSVTVTYDNGSTETKLVTISAAKQGNKGDDGISYYTYFRYSENSDGSNFVTAPTADTRYIGVYTGASSTAPTDKNSYTWSKYVGADGDDGLSLKTRGNWAANTAYAVNDIVYVTAQKKSYVCKTAHTSGSTFSATNWNVLANDGSDGNDATQYYMHFVYCNDTTSGTDYSTSQSRKYIGVYTDTNSADADDFATATSRGVVWSKAEGDDGYSVIVQWNSTIEPDGYLELSDGTLLELSDGTNLFVETGSANWHSDYQEGDRYMRQSTDGGVTWSKPIKAVADEGRGLRATVEYYLACALSEGVTRETSGWTSSPQEMDEQNDYLWKYTVTVYTDGYEIVTEPVLVGHYASDNKTINVVLSAPNVSLSSNASGTVSDYSVSATSIRVFENDTELVYDGTGTANGKWKATVSASNVSGTTVSAVAGTNYASLGAASSMTSDNASRTITVTGKHSDGTDFTQVLTQTLSKNKQGSTGNGGIAVALSDSAVTFTSLHNGKSNYEVFNVTVMLYEGALEQNLSLSSVSAVFSGTGSLSYTDKSKSGNAVILTLKSTYGAQKPDGTVTVTVTHDSKSYVRKISVSSVSQGKYLGLATAVSGDNNETVTISSASSVNPSGSVGAQIGDYIVWGATSAGSFLETYVYEYTRQYVNNAVAFVWVQDNSDEAMMTCLSDIMNNLSASGNTIAIQLVRRLVANEIFVNDLFANQITMMQKDGKGGLIQSNNFNGIINPITGEISNDGTTGWAIDFYGMAFFNKIFVKGGFQFAKSVILQECTYDKFWESIGDELIEKFTVYKEWTELEHNYLLATGVIKMDSTNNWFPKNSERTTGGNVINVNAVQPRFYLDAYGRQRHEVNFLGSDSYGDQYQFCIVKIDPTETREGSYFFDIYNETAMKVKPSIPSYDTHWKFSKDSGRTINIAINF